MSTRYIGNRPIPLLGADGNFALADARYQIDGNCVLEMVSATALRLSRRNGSRLVIGGVPRTIPANLQAANAAVLVNGVANQNLAPSTEYLVSAYMDAGEMKMGFWPRATGHLPDATFGNEIVTGQPGHSLVGGLRTTAASQFVNSGANRLVRSWFNRRRAVAMASVAAGITRIGGSIEASPNLRASIFCWAGETMTAEISGQVTMDTGGQAAFVAASFDGATDENKVGFTPEQPTYYTPTSTNGFADNVSEGVHFYTALISTSNNTMTLTNSRVIAEVG